MTPSPGTLLLRQPFLAKLGSWPPKLSIPLSVSSGLILPSPRVAGSQWKTCLQGMVPAPTRFSIPEEGEHLARTLFKVTIRRRGTALVFSYEPVQRQHFQRSRAGSAGAASAGYAGTEKPCPWLCSCLGVLSLPGCPPVLCQVREPEPAQQLICLLRSSATEWGPSSPSAP